jgi:hypothetical protein
MVSSSSGISDNIGLPEDTRMRVAVRRGAFAALVGLTFNTLTFLIAGPALDVLQVADTGRVYEILHVVLTLVCAPLVILGGVGLKRYPLNRHNVALVALPAVAAGLTLLARFTGVGPYALIGIAWVAADAALLRAADVILKDGAGDPTAPRSRIAMWTLGVVVLRWLYFALPLLRVFGFAPVGLLNVVIVVLTIATFVKVRRALL